MTLVNAGCSYRSVSPRQGETSSDLYVDTQRGGIRLTVHTRAAARQLPRRDRRGQHEVRLDRDELARKGAVREHGAFRQARRAGCEDDERAAHRVGGGKKVGMAHRARGAGDANRLPGREPARSRGEQRPEVLLLVHHSHSMVAGGLEEMS